MWDRIMELQPLINRCARYLAKVYDEDVDELSQRMTMALAEKARQNPDLLNSSIYCNAGIATIIKNEIHTYYRHLFGVNLQRRILPLDDLELADDADDLERQERISAILLVLEHLDAECRELVQAILDNDDLVRDGKRSRKTINVSALARRIGKPWRSVYRDMDHLRTKLAPVVA